VDAWGGGGGRGECSSKFEHDGDQGWAAEVPCSLLLLTDRYTGRRSWAGGRGVLQQQREMRSRTGMERCRDSPAHPGDQRGWKEQVAMRTCGREMLAQLGIRTRHPSAERQRRNSRARNDNQTDECGADRESRPIEAEIGVAVRCLDPEPPEMQQSSRAIRFRDPRPTDGSKMVALFLSAAGTPTRVLAANDRAPLGAGGNSGWGNGSSISGALTGS